MRMSGKVKNLKQKEFYPGYLQNLVSQRYRHQSNLGISPVNHDEVPSWDWLYLCRRSRYSDGGDITSIAKPILSRVQFCSKPGISCQRTRSQRFASSDRMAVGAEALIRYRSKSDTLMLPGNFLPLLEENESIKVMGKLISILSVFEFDLSV